MTEKIIDNQVDNDIRGPKAPKDPIKKRSGFYIMLESAIEASPRKEGRPCQDIFLENRLVEKVRLTSGVEDEKILELLKDCAGIRKLVHSIGVSVRANKYTDQTINFVFQNLGKVNKFSGGTVINVPCTADGMEKIIELKDIQWSDDDDVPGKISFEFETTGETAAATVKFYLNDGYEVPEIAIEPPVAFDSTEYKEMISKSLLFKGNNRRLKNAIEKAERGEDVTIAYIGGSITQGAGAKPINTECYPYQSYLSFKKMFGKDNGDNVNYVKAGVGGTPSELGMIRYERDVLKNGTVKPDVVIVEFAVNDEGDETKGNCFESLILKILSGENKPAVIILFSVFINDWNLQDRLSPVGRQYSVPMVSVKDAVVEQFGLTKEQGNIISKRQYFYDIYHPTNDGHKVMADCIAYLFEETAKSDKDMEDIVIDKAPVIGNSFVNVRLLDREDNTDAGIIEEGSFNLTDTELQMVEMDVNPFGSPEFPYNWMHSPSAGNESFKMTIESRSLLLIFKDSGQDEFGKADVYVDGKLILTADPHVNNWTHCNPVILFNEKVCRQHKIEIKMAEDSMDKFFTILGFAYV